MARTAGRYISPQKFPVGVKIQTTDPVSAHWNSPAPATSTTAAQISAPDWAAKLVVMCQYDTQVSELAGLSAYTICQASTDYEFEVGGMDILYFKGTVAGTTNVYYHWVLAS